MRSDDIASAWMRVGEAAKRAGVSKTTLVQAIQAKQVPFEIEQIGGRLQMIRRAAFEAWIAGEAFGHRVQT